ncbi:putative NAD(P)-binding domain-containing protein [Seiridium cardinale]|uniref:NAD(P)-binding domain-containing protein n=1 Tax=Seiridium cardinale TaxID=138064 RepID=A0ABR2XCW0_9PEZI
MGSLKDSSHIILITGASGQYGRLTVDKLLERGTPPSSLLLVTRDPSKLEVYAARGALVRQGSFDDPVDELAEAFSGADVMLFIATARAGQRLPQHRAAIDAAVLAGVSHIVYTSIVGAHLEQPTALVAQEHRATELMLQSSGVAWTALRDSQYAEALSDVAAGPAIQSGWLRSNSQHGGIALISRNDCVAAAVAVLADPAGHRNRSYEITGPELLTWADVANLIGAAAGTKVQYQALSDEEQYALFDEMGIPRHAIDDVVVQ